MSLQAEFNASDAPPNLNILSGFRNDNVEALSIYTDPQFFRRLWVENMMKDTKAQMEKRKKRKV